MLKQSSIFVALAVLFAVMLSACSNSGYEDEFDNAPVNEYAFEEGSQDTAYIKDTLVGFPPSGFYPGPFTIIFPDDKTLNCAIGGAEPTRNSPAQKSIRIDSTSAVRCADFSTDEKTEFVRTYIFERKPNVPVIFITTDGNSLFDPDTGIYTEGPNAKKAEPHYGANYWLDKEIPVFIELTENDSYVPAFSKYAGLKIFGNYSRANAKKSVAVTFREKYGNKRLHYTLFPEFPELNLFKSIVLRNFGNSFENDYLRDRLASSLSEGLGVDYQRGRYVVVYYNGEYFGIHDMRERSNEYYFETHYGIDHDNINLLKADNSVSAGSATDFVALMDWLEKHNLEDEDNYAYVASRIDMDNLMNYMLVEMYAFNQDWPGNNQKKWNCANRQTPWKWFLYDLDLSFGKTREGNPANVFEYMFSGKSNSPHNAPKHTLLFRSLIKNKEFRAAFINRMTTLLQMNFESSRVLTKIETMMAEIETEISRDQKRWSLRVSKMEKQLAQIKQFAKERPSVVIRHLQEYLKLGTAVPVSIFVQGKGHVLVHGLPLDKTPLTISFFKNFPVTLAAEPRHGSTWSHWSDGDTNTTRTIRPDEAQLLMAVFK
jgi:hypothetical protein